MLSFDRYFNWFYPYKASVPFMCPMPQREQRALDNCRAAIDMHEIFERVTIRNHKSFLMHGAIFKCTRDILTLGNPWAVDLSKLEMQNAESKRVATAAGSRRMQTTTSGMARKPMGRVHEGPARLVVTKGYSTTMALSTLNNLLATQYLRRGDGIVATPLSRRKEKLFGSTGSGRTRHLSTGIKIEKLDSDYNPRDDTCLEAFIRLLAVQNSESPE